MARQFAESTDRVIKLETAIWCKEFLKKLELNMHFALSHDNKNPLAGATSDIYKFICRSGEVKQSEILAMFFDAVEKPWENIPPILEHLRATNKIKLKE